MPWSQGTGEDDRPPAAKAGHDRPGGFYKNECRLHPNNSILHRAVKSISLWTGCKGRDSKSQSRNASVRSKAQLGGAERYNNRRTSHDFMTEHIRKKLQEELNTLERELAHDIPKELKKAIAMGDLSENAEYHMAKQRQEYLKARVRQLGKRLADLSLINMANIPKDKVGLGSTVKIYDSAKDEEVEYQLVTSEESDVAAGKISTTSPIGRALLNKKVGDTAMVVTPAGNREMEVLKLTTIHDEADLGPEAEAK